MCSICELRMAQAMRDLQVSRALLPFASPVRLIADGPPEEMEATGRRFTHSPPATESDVAESGVSDAAE